MKKIMVVFGTRPEAIKMCPLVLALREEKQFETIVTVTGQHKEMLDQVLDCFGVIPHHNLDVMQENQTLFDITITILERMKEVLLLEQPDLVLVHGDTTTTYATALSAFYLGIPVGHVEAGLRTHDIYAPFPEEFNRQSVGILAKYHFAPTDRAACNLEREGKSKEQILVTGNTAIDALKSTIQPNYHHEVLDWAKGSRLIFLTAHRRENLGTPLRHIFQGILRAVREFPDVKIVYPVHPNPSVIEIANEVFGEEERIRLIPPLDVIGCHNMMRHSYLVLTDSGGIQEEAPSLGKPVLVLRDVTERMEGVLAGSLLLVGTNENKVYAAVKEMLLNEESYESMAKVKNPYGDGNASKKIVDFLREELLKETVKE
ncbi:UDP-N-acetylglucosamine 2-epimerase [Lachnospiraceae bacterium KM106-2]|nr:UDP-N-acetylglucosamine 2-epimerase [Lachnospiraceae bacterium KM106-2]